MLYTYRIVKENIVNGERSKRTKTITRNEPLKINGLYAHLGDDLKGFYRVLELLGTEPVED